MAQPLTDAIQALTRYANETTGKSDTTLSDAVETLVEGYGQGGGGSVSQDAEGYIVLPVDGGGDSIPLIHVYDVTIEEETTSLSISFTEPLTYDPIVVAFIPDGDIVLPESSTTWAAEASACVNTLSRDTAEKVTNSSHYLSVVNSSGRQDYYSSWGNATISVNGVTFNITRTNATIRFMAGQKFKVVVMETTDVYR